MEILYQDENIIVVIKPVGMDSEKQVNEKLKEISGSEIYTVHRLDVNVSGVMVYAKHKRSAVYLSKCIQENTMIKEYVAMVHGFPPLKEDWSDFLFKDSRKNKVFVVKKERKGVKKARLEYEVLQSYEDTSLVHIRLHTGRSHQIRVQFASRKFPLVGDHKYGARDDKTSPMLYSCKITFPYKGKNVSFTSFPSWANIQSV